VSADEPRPYRPVALWFMLAVGAVVGLAILAEWLRKTWG
jgi:hypothetical protein